MNPSLHAARGALMALLALSLCASGCDTYPTYDKAYANVQRIREAYNVYYDELDAGLPKGIGDWKIDMQAGSAIPPSLSQAELAAIRTYIHTTRYENWRGQYRRTTREDIRDK